MYETEANGKVESAEFIPETVRAGFAKLRGQILSRTVLPWSEHCTECVWPTCYKSCELYSPREDGRCRRFVDGMVRVECAGAINGYLLKIRFKQWGKLWTKGVLNMRSSERAERAEKRDYQLGSFLYRMSLPKPVKSAIIGKRYGLKKRLANMGKSGGQRPNSFVIECFNPQDRVIDVSFTIRSDMKGKKIPFQRLFRLDPGYHLVKIPFGDIEATIDPTFPFGVELIPGGFEKETTLYFGLMDFVEEVAPVQTESTKIKCVVWDLDHTLWEGVLVEDGSEKLTLKPGIKKIIEELDQRGILQSVASKNNHDEAMAVLGTFGLADYFLYPQISWAPKGEAVKAIARRLNIGIDTLLFVDDQVFEREQVQSSAVGVRTLDASEYMKILDLKQCQSPVTKESRERRKMYQVEQARQQVEVEFKDDYKAFLKHCDIRLTITSLSAENLERVHELTQRTNQMNFSGNKYDRSVLRAMTESDHLDSFVLACQDRFGSYGIVGFGVVDNREPRLTDLMFSCRIQSKRVEHAFLSWIIRKYIAESGKDFCADYRKTPRNAPSGQVFEDLGMTVEGVQGGVTSLVYRHDAELPDDGVIRVEAMTGIETVGTL